MTEVLHRSIWFWPADLANGKLQARSGVSGLLASLLNSVKVSGLDGASSELIPETWPLKRAGGRLTCPENALELAGSRQRTQRIASLQGQGSSAMGLEGANPLAPRRRCVGGRGRKFHLCLVRPASAQPRFRLTRKERRLLEGGVLYRSSGSGVHSPPVPDI